MLERHAVAADAVRHAETVYRAACRARPAAAQGRTARAAAVSVGEAFDVLTESVVELQSARAAVLSQADCVGLSVDEVCELDERFARADHELADYLRALTYGQVRVTAGCAD